MNNVTTWLVNTTECLTNPCGLPDIELGFRYIFNNQEHIVFDYSKNEYFGVEFYYSKRVA